MEWKYLIVEIDRDAGKTVKILDKQGKKGWELVTIYETKQPTGIANNNRAYFKKPINKFVQ